MSIYELFPTLRNHIDMCSDRKKRYVIVFVDYEKHTYSFELDNSYFYYAQNYTNIFVAYRKSGFILFSVFSNLHNKK